MRIKLEKMINISKKTLAADIEAGMKREGIIEKYSTEHYKLTNGDVTSILHSAGLRIRKFKRPVFKIIDDVELPLDPTIAKEVKEIAEQGNPLVDLSGEFNIDKK